MSKNSYEEELKQEYLDQLLEDKIDNYNLDKKLVQSLQLMNIEKLTNVQSKTLKPIIDGKDVWIRADTGTGKTISYLLPILQKLLIDFPRETNPLTREVGCVALIVAPTRELCIQIETTMQNFRRKLSFICCGTLLGGENADSEKKRLRKGVNIVVATPGRLIYHLENTANLYNYVYPLKFLVLDEADRLLEMGFKEKLEKIVHKLEECGVNPENRQTIMVSATLNNELDSLKQIAMKDPEKIGELQDDSLSIPGTLTQYYLVVNGDDRLMMLCALLKSYITPADEIKVIVFVSCCGSATFHSAFFTQFNFMTDQEREFKNLPKRRRKGMSQDEINAIKLMENELKEKVKDPIRDTHASTDNDEIGGFSPFLEAGVFCITGNHDQIHRSKVMSKFNHSKKAVLICTNVLERGIDIPGLKLIVQYDPPNDSFEYVHRAGRTGRIGNIGTTYLFMQPHEIGFIDHLKSNNVDITEMKKIDVEYEAVKAMKGDCRSDKKIDYIMQCLRMETFDCVKSNGMVEDAMQAWTDTVSAYKTISAEIRNYFRLSHKELGKMVDGFGLRDYLPKDIPEILKDFKGRSNEENKKKRPKLRPAFEERTSEFL